MYLPTGSLMRYSAEMLANLYFKLRPPAPTFLDELCQCDPPRPIKLMDALGYNPLHCIDCNGEVTPESLALPIDLVEPIVRWRSVVQSLYLLWLDSGAYEVWAETELRTITSAVNQEGIEVQAMLNSVRRCYFHYFQDQSIDDFVPIQYCPGCQQPLTAYLHGSYRQLICEQCSIITVGK